MKKRIFFFIAGCFMLTGFLLPASPGIGKFYWQGQYKNGEKGFVVMELFTSQGCSSCPPADDILGNYASSADAHIIPLSFHVDYWNKLGWKDPFSSILFTQRQQQYASLFQLESIYTPQLVINGTRELVGSEEGRIGEIVNGFLKEPPAAEITITNKVVRGTKLEISYALNKNLQGKMMNAVLVQDKITTRIRAGENRGLNLVNHNIVLDLQEMRISGTAGNIYLQMPAGQLTDGLSMVLFVQDPGTGKISGAVKQKL